MQGQLDSFRKGNYKMESKRELKIRGDGREVRAGRERHAGGPGPSCGDSTLLRCHRPCHRPHHSLLLPFRDISKGSSLWMLRLLI